jgi:sulfite reductase (NADPH) flavoprotein alpha-component
VTPVLPETAPFTPAQRAWWNGFIAGLLAGAPGPTVPSATAAGPVAYPSPSTAAEPWHDPNLPLDERLARAKDRPLVDRLMAALAQLDCRACGYECRSYADAIASGTEKKLVLCSPGGAPTAAKLKELLHAHVPAPAPVPAAKAAPAPSPPPAPARKAEAAPTKAGRIAFTAHLLAREILHHPGASAPAVHLVLDAAEATESFEPGDSFGVFPENAPEAVDIALAKLGANGRERVRSPARREVSMRVALAEDCDLRDLDEVLASQPPKRPHPSDIAESLGRLKPRLYTLASSPKLHPGEAHLTVAAVPGGLASSWLAQRLPVGGAVRMFVNHGRLRLPRGEVPIVMIGAGSGIAPFRAFLHERKATGTGGWSWLLFGGERQADDLYRAEMKELLGEGVLSRLDKAFPGDATPGVTLAARVLQNGAELWSWLEQGAHVYVSGDARRMAPEVEAALARVVAEHGRKSFEEAKAFLAALSKEKRYQREIY